MTVRVVLTGLMLVLAACGARTAASVEGTSTTSSSGASSGGSSGASVQECPPGQSCAPQPPSPPSPPPPSSDAGTTCAALGPIVGFVPVWHPPAPHQNACTKNQIDDYLAACVVERGARCQKLLGDPAAKACTDCIRTPSSAPMWGPVVQFPNRVAVNTAGCVALLEGNDRCARAVAARIECDDLACSTCTLTSDSTSWEAIVKCNAFANDQATMCLAYTRPATCADPYLRFGQCVPDVAPWNGWLVTQFCLAQ